MAAVLVTGGTQRLGLAMVESLLEKNIPVIVTYRTHKPTVDALQKQGADVVCCDFAKPNAVAELITYITSKYSVLRWSIHNASDWDQEKGCENFAALFDKMMHVHASVPYQLNLALQPLFPAGGCYWTRAEYSFRYPRFQQAHTGYPSRDSNRSVG